MYALAERLHMRVDEVAKMSMVEYLGWVEFLTPNPKPGMIDLSEATPEMLGAMFA